MHIARPTPTISQAKNDNTIKRTSIEAYREILRTTGKDNPFSLLTVDDETKFTHATTECYNHPFPEQCSKEVDAERDKLLASRRQDLVRLTPPRLQMDAEGDALRLAKLPEWHPEKKMMKTFLAGLEPYLNHQKPMTPGQSDAMGRACLDREAQIRARNFANALIQQPITELAEARDRDRRLAIMAKLGGDVNSDRPRVQRSTTFEDTAHKEAYRVQSEAFIHTTQESIRAMQKTFHDRETDVIYKNWELRLEKLRACRESKGQCP